MSDNKKLKAGLFSAALVAFLTISCPMLNADANATQNEFLLRITVQMHLLQSGANNVTLPPLPSPSSTFQPPFAVFVANMCWFFSLTIALGTVLFGTVCLQWIREFERDPHLGCKEALEFRQMRYEGLMGWGIPFLISSLPVLLQLCLLLFFLGLSFFLQSFDPVIAAAICVLMALIVVFLCVTMMLPALQCVTSSSKNHDQRSSLCPFKSPHAFLVTVFVAWSSLILIDIFIFFSSNPYTLEKKKKFFTKILQDGSSWTSVDMAWLNTSYPESCGSPQGDRPHSPAALAWLAGTYASSYDALCTFYHCLRDSNPSTAIKTLERLTSRDLNWAIDHPDIEYFKDIRSALALEIFVKASPQLHDSLLAHRVELFVRILNQCIMPRVGRPPGQTADVHSLFEEKLLVPLEGENDFVILDDGELNLIYRSSKSHFFCFKACKLQLIKTFFSYLEAKKIHDFLTDVVINIVHTTMTIKRTKHLTSDQMLREELSAFNKKLLNDYLNKSEGTEKFKDDVKKLVKKYIEKFGKDGYTGRFQSFKTSFTFLAREV